MPVDVGTRVSAITSHYFTLDATMAQKKEVAKNWEKNEMCLVESDDNKKNAGVAKKS